MPDQEAGRTRRDDHRRAGPGAVEDMLPVAPSEAEEADLLAARTAELEAEVRDLDDKWRRAMAELDNSRKRQVRDLDRERAGERARVVGQLLPIVDNLDLALEHARADPKALAEGVRVVRDQAVAAVERLGFGRHDEVGVPFDPVRHEAMGTVATSDVARGTVVRVVRPGYGNGDTQLRPAGVIVATEKPKSTEHHENREQ
jgi:molecular chaperone GrpE